MSGSWNDINHFFHSMENTFRGASNYTSGFNMATESGIAHQNAWDMTVNRASMGSFQDHVFAGGYSYLYGGSNSRTDRFNITNESDVNFKLHQTVVIVEKTLHGVVMVDLEMV